MNSASASNAGPVAGSESAADRPPEIPSYQDLMFPTLSVLVDAGQGVRKDDLDDEVIGRVGITPDQLSVDYGEGASQSGSKVLHRLAWARSYLKKLGAVTSDGTGLWTATADGRELLEKGEEELRHREHELRVGQRPDEFLQAVAKAVSSGEVLQLTVDELLAKWGVSRRGASVVLRIRRDLFSVAAVTSPPFDAVPLRSVVALVPAAATELGRQPESRDPETAPERRKADESPGGDESRTGLTTVTIGTLETASGGLLSAAPDWTIVKAQSLMESHDYSQLAVLAGERSLKGAISWESIARASLYGEAPEFVRQALDRSAKVVSYADPLLDYVDVIADAGFVFVEDQTEKVVGIVTASDLANEFAKMANPFLLIGEIEGLLREMVDAAFGADELAEYVDPDDPEREIVAAASLTLGEYVRLFEDPAAWSRLALRADRKVFRSHLADVARIRNSVMHFSPDPVSQEDTDRIAALLRWVRLLAAADRSNSDSPVE